MSRSAHRGFGTHRPPEVSASEPVVADRHRGESDSQVPEGAGTAVRREVVRLLGEQLLAPLDPGSGATTVARTAVASEHHTDRRHRVYRERAARPQPPFHVLTRQVALVEWLKGPGLYRCGAQVRRDVVEDDSRDVTAKLSSTHLLFVLIVEACPAEGDGCVDETIEGQCEAVRTPLVVIVEECEVAATGGRRAGIACGGRSSTGCPCDHANAGIVDVRRRNGATVVDDEAFEVGDGLRQNRPDGVAYHLGPVACRDDDREQRVFVQGTQLLTPSARGPLDGAASFELAS